MYHPWFSKDELRAVKRYVKFTKVFRRVAFEVAKFFHALSPEGFNAIHVRMGDYASRRTTSHHGIPFTASLADTLEKEGMNLSLPMYVATEPSSVSNTHFWKPLRDRVEQGGHQRIFFSTDLSHVFTDFLELFDRAHDGDLVGLVEQLICVASVKFHGSWYSNLSENIGFMREVSDLIFPELSYLR